MPVYLLFLKLNESTDLTTTDEDDDEENTVVWKDGKRFHKIHRSPINSHIWAVLILEDDNEAAMEGVPQSSYTVSHKF
uniref:Uncharacterized protein n=1 Tax=Panagrolaimus superbus TaxID=310955 RepID=A0A914YXN8_9BILA